MLYAASESRLLDARVERQYIAYRCSNFHADTSSTYLFFLQSLSFFVLSPDAAVAAATVATSAAGAYAD
jgi:hypothetical protein